jgi:hypothetical protein
MRTECPGPVRDRDDGALYCRRDYRRDIDYRECPDCAGEGCEYCGMSGWIDPCEECRAQVDEFAIDYAMEAI